MTGLVHECELVVDDDGNIDMWCCVGCSWTEHFPVGHSVFLAELNKVWSGHVKEVENSR